ncbi:MAG TPA: hypothetical protein VGN13_11935 [Solirubrobacteraceae bacterium]
MRSWLIASVVLGASLGAVGTASARAAVIHEFLTEPSQMLTKGVPLGSGAAVTGRFAAVGAMTDDGGDVFIASKVPGGGATSVSRFADSSGAYLPPQLNEVGSLTNLEFGVAVGHATGEEEVYVGAIDEGGQRVAVFGSSGALQATWSGAATPQGSFTGGGELTGIAVDSFANALEDWASGDVYVATGGREHNFVDVFRPTAGGTEPELAAQLAGTCAASHETCNGGEVVPFGRPTELAVSGFNGDVFVGDENRVVDMFAPGPIAGQYEFLGALNGPPPTGEFGEVKAIAADAGNGDVYVAEEHVVNEFDRAGNYVGHITGTPDGAFSDIKGLAVDPTSHDVFLGDFEEASGLSRIDAFGPNTVVPDVETGAAIQVKPTSAVLRGTVTSTQGAATCRFAWGTSSEFGQTAPCSAPVPEGASPAAVEASLSGLQPDTAYFFRLQATSDLNGKENPGEGAVEFTTPGPGIRAESASAVTAESATLEATIDPHGAATSYYFQYGPTSAYGSEAPAAPGPSLGSSAGGVEVSPQHLQGLAPATTYHYRVVAVSALEGEDQVFAGQDQTFTTQQPGAAFSLPDGRRWEMVSPADKRGAEVEALGQGNAVQAAPRGNAMTFVTTAPTEAEPEGNANFVQVLAARGAQGWTTHDLTSAHEAATGVGANEYRMFSEDLALGIDQPLGGFTRALSPAASEQTAYLHTNFPAGQPSVFCAASCYLPLVTAQPGYTNVPPGTTFGEEGACANVTTHKTQCGPEAIGATPDLSHVVLNATVALTPGMNAGTGLYEWAAGRLAPVSVLPCSPEPCQGEPATNSPVLGFEGQVDRNAVSADGSRIIWSEHGGHLYLRDVTAAQTLQIDTVAPGGSGVGLQTPRYQAASADGSRIFFTDNQQLTSDAGGQAATNAEGDLYECHVVEQAGSLRCQLTDLTPAGAGGEPATVLNVVTGASEDGSWVYFVADGALAPGAARGTCGSEAQPEPPVHCNLFVWHSGVTKLVAVLSGSDFPDWNGTSGTHDLGDLTARVSPDGHLLTFVSDRSLTGYDTRDAKTDRPDEEVYVYDAISGNLSCVSCAPSGARPQGLEYGDMTNPLLLGVKVWDARQGLAGSLPAWTSYSGGQHGAESIYQSRYLSDNGRLFFDSADALVPKDTNGTTDVYEFEPPGVGGCTTATSSGSVLYSPQAGGCVGLISSGTAQAESGFLDASAGGGRDAEGHEGGGDVFFITTGKLAAQDFDASADVYDAHECSAAAPCYPTAGTEPPPCETSDSCRAAPTPQAAFGAPASSVLASSGNLAPPAPAKTRTPAQVRAEKLARALRACRAKHNKRRRKACVRAAQRRYGHTTARHATTKRRRK